MTMPFDLSVPATPAPASTAARPPAGRDRGARDGGGFPGALRAAQDRPTPQRPTESSSPRDQATAPGLVALRALLAGPAGHALAELELELGAADAEATSFAELESMLELEAPMLDEDALLEGLEALVGPLEEVTVPTEAIVDGAPTPGEPTTEQAPDVAPSDVTDQPAAETPVGGAPVEDTADVPLEAEAATSGPNVRANGQAPGEAVAEVRRVERGPSETPVRAEPVRADQAGRGGPEAETITLRGVDPEERAPRVIVAEETRPLTAEASRATTAAGGDPAPALLGTERAAAARMTAAGAAGLQRVLDVLELLEQAPPPRQLTLDLGDARVRVALEDGQVRLSLLSGQNDATDRWLEQTRQALSERGFDLAREGRDGAASDEAASAPTTVGAEGDPDTDGDGVAAARLADGALRL
ncbi:MAG: hypothetical protein JJT89_10350 [Nitriliruptoraceae bacterium]|nr:hypothetical protein [Nitriliruptoraceae bacterium]